MRFSCAAPSQRWGIGLDPLLLDDENPTEMTEEVEEEQNLSRLDQEDSEKKSKKALF